MLSLVQQRPDQRRHDVRAPAGGGNSPSARTMLAADLGFCLGPLAFNDRAADATSAERLLIDPFWLLGRLQRALEALQ